MKTFSSLTRRMQSETNFYCIELTNVFRLVHKLIYVSTPLSYDEMKRFIERRVKNRPEAVRILDSYMSLTPIEKEELYGLDSFARILDAINMHRDKEFEVTYVKKDTGEFYAKITSDWDEVCRILRDELAVSVKTVKY